MNRNVYVSIATIIAILVVAYLFFGDRAGSPSPEALEPNSEVTEDEILLEEEVVQEGDREVDQEEMDVYEVVYTNAGFEPRVLTVPLGTTVTFRNQSSRSMWIASDPHPTHTDYPQFDTRRGVAPGENYGFSFEREGSWSYHDHLFPTVTGTIIVE